MIQRPSLLPAIACVLATALIACGSTTRPTIPDQPAPAMDTNTGSKSDTITLGAGCFWCVEAVFLELKGVRSVTSGYMGGHVKNPSYREVCTGSTGHAEVARIVYDPEQLTVDELLEVFWQTHDPTTMNRQGADVGTQYRSGIYTTSAEQNQTAQAAIADLAQQGIHAVTEVAPLQNYQKAEDYHQGYAQQHPQQPYCRLVALPKLEKARAQFGAWMA